MVNLLKTYLCDELLSVFNNFRRCVALSGWSVRGDSPYTKLLIMSRKAVPDVLVSEEKGKDI
jgi:hypothetical protein